MQTMRATARPSYEQSQDSDRKTVLTMVGNEMVGWVAPWPQPSAGAYPSIQSFTNVRVNQ
jgi:hypothetical protein